MALTDFSVPTSKLFWAEDYYSYFNNENGTYWKDTGYETLTTTMPSFSSPSHNLRYQYALSNMKRSHIVEVSAGTYTDKYVCLALGYQIFYVTIKKTGLQEGESSVFNILKSGNNDPYITMLLTGSKDGEPVVKRVALPEGIWTVTEIGGWSWTYECKNNKETKTVDNDDVVFSFENKKESNTILHDEDIKVNKMGKQTTPAPYE